MIRTRLPRQLAAAALVVAALAASSLALAAGTLNGKYATTIKSPPNLKGTWVLNLQAGGTYTVALNDRALARGTYSATATTITLREPAANGCGGSGKYTWRKSGKTLRFTRITESPQCAARAGVLVHTFVQVEATRPEEGSR